MWEKKEAYHFISESVGAKARFIFKDIIGVSESFQGAIGLAKKASKTNANILLIGETGTGKELIAQAIHNESKYRKGPFVAVNCSAIPRELIESELFDMKLAPSPALKKEGARANLNWPTEAPFSWMKLEICPWKCRPRY